jgi:tetratricopeptide (TPR) repeat protein
VNDAERTYQRAMNLRPGFWLYPHLLGHLYLKTARYDAAANQWREVNRCAPEYATGYSNLGIALWYLGDEDAVEREFLRSIELAPDSSYSTYSNLGTLYFGQARYADAIAMFEKALAEDDTHYKVWGNLGFAHAQTSDPTRAVDPFRRAIEIAEGRLQKTPDDLNVLTDIASYHAMIGERRQTLDYLDRSIALEPTIPDQMVSIGEAYLDIGHRDEAVVWIRNALIAGMPEERILTRPKLRELIDEARPDPEDGA